MAEQMAQALLDAMSEAVYVVDRRRRITFWNPAAERLTGFAAGDVIGHPCRDGILNHVDETGRLLCRTGCPLLKTMRSGEPSRMHVFLHHRDGHRVPVEVSAAVLRDESGRVTGAVEVFHDDSHRQELAEQLGAAEVAALVDPLTGIGNRRLLHRALAGHDSDYRRYGRPFAVLFADIDHFKSLNDRLGHDVGDKVLQLVAHTLQRCVRPGDTVGRWGGEEFLVLAPASTPGEALALADRVRSLISSTWLDADGSRVSVTLSLGATVVVDTDTPTSIVRRADEALYAAKRAGRNRTVVA